MGFRHIVGTMTVALVLAGCATVQESSVGTGSFPQALRSTEYMRQVRLGMTIAEARSLLDEEAIIGYERSGERYTPMTLKNPYRFETVTRGKTSYEVYFYFMGIKQADGRVSDEELFPLIFEGNQLVGKGWDFYAKFVKASGT